MASKSGFEVQVGTPFDTTIAEQDNRPQESDFNIIEGLRTSGLNFSSTPIDATSASSGEYREILDDHGTTMVDVSFEGIERDSPLHKELVKAIGTKAKLRWFFIKQGDGTKYYFKGKIVSLSNPASYDDVVGLTLELQSSGDLTIEDANGNIFSGASKRFTTFTNQVASLNIKTFLSSERTLADATALTDIATAIDNYLATQTTELGNAAVQATTPVQNVVINNAGGTASMFVFPILFVQKNLVQGKRLQAVDNLGNNVRLEPLAERTISGVEYLGYYINKLLNSGEETIFTLEAG